MKSFFNKMKKKVKGKTPEEKAAEELKKKQDMLKAFVDEGYDPNKFNTYC